MDKKWFIEWNAILICDLFKQATAIPQFRLRKIIPPAQKMAWAGLTFFFLCIFLAFTPKAKVIQVEVNLAPVSSLPQINPGIYGIGTYLGEKDRNLDFSSLKPEIFRFGGNMSERFNWKINSWNSGKDWYFRNFKSDNPEMVDAFMKKNRELGIGSMITIPMMGWIAKDSTSGSYPVHTYPNQKNTKDGFGNGLDQNSNPIKANPYDANTPLNSAYITDWVNRLKSQFGSHPHRYIIGNEPMLWHETHRDVHPLPATYDEVLSKYLATARLVRTADPEAILFGPALWGYLAVKQSAFDGRGPWSFGLKDLDKMRHGGADFLEWFLREVAKEEKKQGISLLDVVDIHYYPEGELIRNGQTNLSATRSARLASTRSLWDRNYRDPSWIDEKLYFIPRLKELIRKANPKLRLAIGEYNFYGETDVSGGIALAEVLGIFSKEQLDYAAYWTIPPEKSPAHFAFRLFRNYDSKGSAFGNRLVANSFGVQSHASVFSSLREKDNTIVMVLLNKSEVQTADFEIAIKNSLPLKSVKFFTFDEKKMILESKDLNLLKEMPRLPPYNMGVLELRR